MPPPYDVVFVVPKRERYPPPCMMSSLRYQRDTEPPSPLECDDFKAGFKAVFIDDSHHFGDEHVTYSYDLDCEKQEHWNCARITTQCISLE